MSPGARNVSLAEVARLAGVSLATASRALNDSYGVSAATKQRVLEVAAKAEYVASPEAARLASGRTMRVGLVVPHVERWFFGEMVAGIAAVLRDAGMDLLLYTVGDVEDRGRFFRELPARRKVDAVVLIGMPIGEQERARLELMGVTIVAVGGQSVDYPYVCIDDHHAGTQAVHHLLQLGHQRIGMIAADDPDQPMWPREPGRYTAYTDALRGAGLDIDEDLIVTGDWGPEHGAEAMGHFLSLRQPPTAVYAHSDEVALGALRTARRAGLRVPEDISVIGIDDHPLAAMVDLTTVGQPVRRQAQLAGEMLLKLLQSEEGTATAVTLPTRLVVRRSTAPVSPG